MIEPLGRGVFRLTSMPDFSELDLVLAAKRVPQGVVCLISALSYKLISLSEEVLFKRWAHADGLEPSCSICATMDIDLLPYNRSP